MPRFTIEELRTGQLREAWPVARMAGLHASPDWWLTDARKLIERGGGVLASRAPDGTIHGLATCEKLGKPPTNVLQVEIFITFEFCRDAPVRRGLRESLNRIAARLNCNRIVWLQPSKTA